MHAIDFSSNRVTQNDNVEIISVNSFEKNPNMGKKGWELTMVNIWIMFVVVDNHSRIPRMWRSWMTKPNRKRFWCTCICLNDANVASNELINYGLKLWSVNRKMTEKTIQFSKNKNEIPLKILDWATKTKRIKRQKRNNFWKFFFYFYLHVLYLSKNKTFPRIQWPPEYVHFV